MEPASTRQSDSFGRFNKEVADGSMILSVEREDDVLKAAIGGRHAGVRVPRSIPPGPPVAEYL